MKPVVVILRNVLNISVSLFSLCKDFDLNTYELMRPVPGIM